MGTIGKILQRSKRWIEKRQPWKCQCGVCDALLKLGSPVLANGSRGLFISEAWLQFGEQLQWSHAMMCQSWQPAGGVIQGWTCSPHPISRYPEVCIHPTPLDVSGTRAGGPAEVPLNEATLCFHPLASDSWFIPRQGLVPIDRPVNALTRKVFLMNCGHRNQQIQPRTEHKLSLEDIKKDSKCWDNSLPLLPFSVVYWEAV